MRKGDYIYGAALHTTNSENLKGDRIYRILHYKLCVLWPLPLHQDSSMAAWGMSVVVSTISP